MKLIVETTSNLNLNNFPKIKKEEKEVLKTKMTRSLKRYTANYFDLNLNSDSPEISFNDEYGDYGLPIVYGWDSKGNPNEFISRIWYGGVEVFNFEDYEYYVVFLDKEDNYYEVMYLKDKQHRHNTQEA